MSSLTPYIGAIDPKDVQTVFCRVFDSIVNALNVIGVAGGTLEGSQDPKDVKTVITRVYDSANQALRVTVSGGDAVLDILKLYDLDDSNTLSITWGENDNADRTLQFLVNGTDRTITLSGSPTLGDWFDQSVKTTSNVLFNKLTATTTVSGASVALVYANPITVNMALGNMFTTTTVNATGNATINATGGTAGQKVTFVVTNDATSSKTITFGTNFQAGNTIIGVPSTTKTADFAYDGTTWQRTGGGVSYASTVLTYANPISVDMSLGNMFTFTTTPIAGSYDLKITNGDATQAYVGQNVKTAANENYYFSGLHKSAATPNGASQLVDIDGDASKGITVIQAGATVASTLKSIDFCFQAGDTDTTVDLGMEDMISSKSGFMVGSPPVKLI